MLFAKELILILGALLLTSGGCGDRRVAGNSPTLRESSQSGPHASDKQVVDKPLRRGMTLDEAFAALDVESAAPPFGCVHHLSCSVVSKHDPGRVIDLEFDLIHKQARLSRWSLRKKVSTEAFVPVCSR